MSWRLRGHTESVLKSTWPFPAILLGRWRAVSILVGGLIGLVLGTTAWAQPSAVSAAPAAPVVTPVAGSELDLQALLFVERLAAASGRSLVGLAELVENPSVGAPDPGSPGVGGASEVTDKYAETLAQLTLAERAAAENLAQTKSEVARAQADQTKTASELAKEESAAAKQIDDALDAAIDAARAQTLLDNGSAISGGPITGAVGSGGATNTTQVLALVREYFPAGQVGNAMAVSRCESGHANRVGRANGNGTRDYGIFQINDGGTLQAALRRVGVKFADARDAREKALDPELNIRMARAIFDARGWQPWVCAAKVGVVAGLYQRAPGPMAGRFDELGRAR